MTKPKPMPDPGWCPYCGEQLRTLQLPLPLNRRELLFKVVCVGCARVGQDMPYHATKRGAINAHLRVMGER